MSTVHVLSLASRVMLRPNREGSMSVARRSRSFLVPLLALAFVAVACGDDSSPGGSSAPSDLTGSLTISGSSTVQPITQLVAEKFSDANPEVQVSVDGPGTGDGFVLFCEGKTDISDASRTIEDDEAAACEQAGIHYVELEIGLDGITVMTNPANGDITCLNFGDLYALFGPESEGFENWSDANQLASQVGGTGNFPDAPLTIVAPGEESGTYDTFIDLAGIEDQALADGVAEDDAAALRRDYTSSPNDNVIIQGIEGSDSALGFVGFAFADQQGDNIKKIAVDGGDGCVEPSQETISGGTYPLSRSLYIYVNTDKLASSDALQAFVDYYLSDEGIASVGEADYVDLPADRIEATRSAWEAV
jgi:phosphate transport system substrate-binding protein